MSKSNNTLNNQIYVELVAENYATLLFKVKEFYSGIEVKEVMFSNFVSDRYSKKAYYVALIEEKVTE